MLPRRLQIVDEKLKNGHFRSGFQELEKVYDSSNPLDRVFMAEFLLRMEGADKAQTLARQILETTNIHVSVQARACAVLALSLVRVNLVGEVIKLLERAVHLATKAGDHDLLCKAQIELLVAKFNLFGPTSLGTLPAEVWRNVRSSGDPSLFSLLHCRFGTLEGLRGAL